MNDAVAELVGSVRFDPAQLPDAGVRVTSRVLYRDPSGAFKTGFWSALAGPPAPISYTMDELCVLLQGEVRLVDAAGHAETYRAGDTFVIPKGFVGTWETVADVRKFFAVFKPV